jgi:hypothetical protein
MNKMRKRGKHFKKKLKLKSLGWIPNDRKKMLNSKKPG